MDCHSLFELSDPSFSRHRFVPKCFKHILLMFYNFPDTTIDNKSSQLCFLMGSCWSKIFYLTYHKIAFDPIKVPNLIYNRHQLFAIGNVSICDLGKVSQFHTSAFGMNEGFLYRIDRNSQWWSCVIHTGVNMLSSVREKLQFFTDNFLGTIHNLCPFSKVIKGQRK